MALFRFEAKIISRSGGKGAVHAAAYRSGKCATSAAAYRAGQTLTDERTGQTFDYSRKRGIEGAEILAPAYAPEWAHDRQQLWNQVERIEKRKDSQLARDFIISLPHELDGEQRRALLSDYLTRHFIERGYVCDVAYHAPHGKGDDRNHHAHVMVPMRAIDEQGFAAKKQRPEGNPTIAWKNELEQLRADWAQSVNRQLEAAGSAERVDHRSNAAQDNGREPETKQGPIATQMEREGRDSLAGSDRRRIKAENEARAAARAQLDNIIFLEVERMRRGMDQPSDELLERQAKREAQGLNEMREQEERIKEFTRRKEQEAEDAREREKQQKEAAERQAQAGEIADANARYSIALGQNYDVKDPYASLAKAAMSEYAAFHKGQEDIRKEMAREQDENRRAELDLRRQIEANEYMAITSNRLAGIGLATSGRDDNPNVVLDRERAVAYQQRAYELREQYDEAQQQRQQQENDHAATQDKAKKDRENPAPGARQSNDNQPTSTGEMSDAKQAKLDRLKETDAAYDAHDGHKQEQARSGPGRGGMSR